MEGQQTLQAGGLGEDVVKEEAVLLGAEEGDHGDICLGGEEEEEDSGRRFEVIPPWC